MTATYFRLYGDNAPYTRLIRDDRMKAQAKDTEGKAAPLNLTGLKVLFATRFGTATNNAMPTPGLEERQKKVERQRSQARAFQWRFR